MSERTGPRRQAKALTPWHDAIRRADVEAVLSLLASGADIDALDERGQTGLMNAVYWGNLDLAACLVERGADLNRAAKMNLTALYLAVINDRPEFVRLLVRAGADTGLAGSEGPFARPPLEYATAHGMKDIVRILEEPPA